MQVDENWEDGIGKKLYDFEADLPPQAWNNINQRIKPRRHKRFFWLPALLAFLILPGAWYLADSNGWFQAENQNQVQQTSGQLSGNEVASQTRTVPFQKQKPVVKESGPAEELLKNSSLPADRTTANNSFEGSEVVVNAPENAPINPKTKPGKNLLAAGSIGSSRPGQLLNNEEENRSETEATKEQTQGKAVHSSPTSVRSGKQQAGALAFHAAGRRTVKKPAAPEFSGAKTVGFSPEKPAETFHNAALAGNSGIAGSSVQNAQTSHAAEIINVREMIRLDFKNTSIANGSSATAFPETLPDSLKKQLLTGLPEPENATANMPRKENKNADSKWSFAVFGTPQYTFQRVLPNREDDLSIRKMENKNAFESERLGYEFGFRTYYTIRKNLQVTVGFQLARLNQHVKLRAISLKPDSVVVSQQNNQISMQIYQSERREERLFQYYLGGIFTGLNLRLSEKLDLSGGLGLNWLLQEKTATENAQAAAATFNPYLNLGLQYQQPLSSKLTIKAGPTMHYYLKPMQEKQAFIGVKPTVIGFSVVLPSPP